MEEVRTFLEHAMGPLLKKVLMLVEREDGNFDCIFIKSNTRLCMFYTDNIKTYLEGKTHE